MQEQAESIPVSARKTSVLICPETVPRNSFEEDLCRGKLVKNLEIL